jgi:hypothetical protein
MTSRSCVGAAAGVRLPQALAEVNRPPFESAHATAAAILSPISSMLAFVVLVIAVCQGNPRTFEVIRKTRETTTS